MYHLDEQESIDVDGKLDDKAWTRVSWTEDFIGDHIIAVVTGLPYNEDICLLTLFLFTCNLCPKRLIKQKPHGLTSQ